MPKRAPKCPHVMRVLMRQFPQRGPNMRSQKVIQTYVDRILRPVEYAVQFDDTEVVPFYADSLAHLVAQLKSNQNRPSRVRVWVQSSGVQMIDTKFGNIYGLSLGESK